MQIDEKTHFRCIITNIACAKKKEEKQRSEGGSGCNPNTPGEELTGRLKQEHPPSVHWHLSEKGGQLMWGLELPWQSAL